MEQQNTGMGIARAFFRRRGLLLLLVDLCIYFGVYGFCFTVMHFASGLRLAYGASAFLYLVLLPALFLFAARFIFRSYRNVWRYASMGLYLRCFIYDAVGIALALPTAYLYRREIVDALDVLLCGVCVTCATFLSRVVYQVLVRRRGAVQASHAGKKIKVAIVGAGQTGTLLADELTSSDFSHYRPVCFIERDVEKIGKYVLGLRVYPENESVLADLDHLGVQEIFIALPNIDNDMAKSLNDFYRKAGYKVKLYDFPMKEDFVETEGARRVLREIKIEDLLFRDALKINTSDVKAFYTDKTVMVTGGGGSIGSELCRQIAKRKPRKLIILDIYENNAYDIQMELQRKYGEALDLAVEIASVRDRERLDAIFDHYRPEIVLHAAAHKHVPLMEHSACEAIKNNVMGTYNTADMAEKYGCSKFILISTDKAVNPTNVMGASKRLCEMVVQCRRDSETAFAAVRFGNVLGSNGSVIPLFRRQIEAGGPITLTDKRIIRYFMTIPEASQLVMQAGAMAKKGQLFVLDMGKPVKILDLAENMIRLAGFTPYKDIDIKEIGLRPGEKLYEELLIKTEKLEKTENDMIFIEEDTPYTREEVDRRLAILRDAVAAASHEVGTQTVRLAMKQVVDTFVDPEEVNLEKNIKKEEKGTVVPA